MMASELKQELSKLATPQDANIQLATQVQNQLTQATTQATNSKLVPRLLAAQMHTAEQLFNTEALQPMRDLLQSMRNAGDPQKPTPSTAAMADSAQRIQQQLESMRARLDALARAQQNMKNDPSAALAQLRMDLMAQNAQLTAQELGELRDFLDRLTGQMKMLEGRENELARHTKQAMPVVLPEIDKEQGQIESDAEKLLAQTDQILQTENMRDMKRLPRLPNDTAAKSAAEREERSHHAPRDDQPRHSPDSGPPEFSSAEMKSAKASQRKHGLRTEEDEEMFTPPGVKQKNGPRATKTARSNGMESDDQTTSARQRAEASRAQPPMAEPRQSSHADSVRDQLARRQERTAQQLQEGQEKLQPPRDRIAQLLERLREAFGPENDEAIQQLAKVIESMDMQHAMQLAQAARRARQQAERATGQLSQQPQATPQAQGTAIELNTAMRAGIASEFEANDLGLAAQAVLLRLQPRVREELLKGMREEGPEAYRKFIEEYFNRLTKIKTPSVQGN
jgi:hypothetical protein